MTIPGFVRCAAVPAHRAVLFYDPHRVLPALALIILVLALSAAAEERLVSERAEPDSPDPARPAKDPQTYRPGLRNSFTGRQLNAKELKIVLESLREKTGFTHLRFDESGFLTVDDRREFVGGSAAARELLLAAIDGKKSINLQSHNRSREVIFARLGVSALYLRWNTETRVEVLPIEIDFADFNFLRGEKKVLAAFDPGFVLLHELCHAVLELRDPAPGEEVAGDCERYINRIRRELSLPERQQYMASASQQVTMPSEPTRIVAELMFAQTEPGAPADSHAKTKRFYLTWEMPQVGRIKQNAEVAPVRDRRGAAVTSAP
jgi:hypothetical protein